MSAHEKLAVYRWEDLVFSQPAAELSSTAKAIARAIARRASLVTDAEVRKQARKNRLPDRVELQTFATWPRLETLADDTGQSDERMVSKYVAALVAGGWLTRTHRPAQNLPDVYQPALDGQPITVSTDVPVPTPRERRARQDARGNRRSIPAAIGDTDRGPSTGRSEGTDRGSFLRRSGVLSAGGAVDLPPAERGPSTAPYKEEIRIDTGSTQGPLCDRSTEASTETRSADSRGAAPRPEGGGAPPPIDDRDQGQLYDVVVIATRRRTKVTLEQWRADQQQAEAARAYERIVRGYGDDALVPPPPGPRVRVVNEDGFDGWLPLDMWRADQALPREQQRYMLAPGYDERGERVERKSASPTPRASKRSAARRLVEIVEQLEVPQYVPDLRALCEPATDEELVAMLEAALDVGDEGVVREAIGQCIDERHAGSDRGSVWWVAEICAQGTDELEQRVRRARAAWNETTASDGDHDERDDVGEELHDFADELAAVRAVYDGDGLAGWSKRVSYARKKLDDDHVRGVLKRFAKHGSRANNVDAYWRSSVEKAVAAEHTTRTGTA